LEDGTSAKTNTRQRARRQRGSQKQPKIDKDDAREHDRKGGASITRHKIEEVTRAMPRIGGKSQPVFQSNHSRSRVTRGVETLSGLKEKKKERRLQRHEPHDNDGCVA